MGRSKKGEPVHGWVNFDKPLGMTSTQAVGKVRFLFNAQKAGHAGTLDPLATGILPIALGEATKTVPYLMDADKIYRFHIKWGESTRTQDAEGEVYARSDARPTEDAIRAALPEFIGLIDQVPPAFSAIKVDGQRAYDLARDGVEVELKSRQVEVYDLVFDQVISADEASFLLHCGKGTYVRSIARDLCAVLGVEGHVCVLRRERVGAFTTDESITLEKLSEIVHTPARLSALQAVGTALDDIPALPITTDEADRLRQGRDLILTSRQHEALRVALDQGVSGFPDTVQAVCGDKVVALCELDGLKLHPSRILHL